MHFLANHAVYAKFLGLYAQQPYSPDRGNRNYTGRGVATDLKGLRNKSFDEF